MRKTEKKELNIWKNIERKTKINLKLKKKFIWMIIKKFWNRKKKTGTNKIKKKLMKGEDKGMQNKNY